MKRFKPVKNEQPLQKVFRSLSSLVSRDIKVRDSDILLGLIVTFLKPLFFLGVIVGAVTLGLRGIQAESAAINFLFPLLFWFYFNDAAMKVNLLDTQEQLKALPNIQPITMMIAAVLSEFIINGVMLGLVFMILFFLQIEINYFYTLILFLVTTLFTLTYIYTVSLLVYQNQVLIKFHDIFSKNSILYLFCCCTAINTASKRTKISVYKSSLSYNGSLEGLQFECNEYLDFI